MKRIKIFVIPPLALALIISAIYIADKVYPGLAAKNLPTADKVIVNKTQRTLSLVRQGHIIKTYAVSLGNEPIGHKKHLGDSRTPEGDYLLDWRNANSQYHLSIHISYPNDDDKTQAEKGGYSPGGAIMIHGRPNWVGWIDIIFNGQDWTDGCIAVNNIQMEEIWQSVPNGTAISILP
ncbi:L,D-transpeptidase family protein [Kaarinaea lacus]